jgi:hypothetical protein
VNDLLYVVEGINNEGDLSIRRRYDGEVLDYKPDQTSFDILRGNLIKK